MDRKVGEHLFAGEYAGDFIPLISVVLVREVEDSTGAGFVGRFGQNTAVVHGELGKVGQNRKRKLGAPGIAAKLVSGIYVVFDVNGGLFSL